MFFDSNKYFLKQTKLLTESTKYSIDQKIFVKTTKKFFELKNFFFNRILMHKFLWFKEILFGSKIFSSKCSLYPHSPHILFFLVFHFDTFLSKSELDKSD